MSTWLRTEILMIMKHKSRTLVAGIVLIAVMAGCSQQKKVSDAYGNFETVTLLVSARGSGQLEWFRVEEGKKLSVNDTVGLIDTTALSLQKKTLLARLSVIRAKGTGLDAKKEVMRRQLMNARVEQKRIQGLFDGHAATQQQLDNVNGKVDVLKLQIREMDVQRQSVLREMDVVRSQIAAVKDRIDKCFILPPADGMVLEKYAEAGELVQPGKTLFKLGDMTHMYLRVYVDETLLPEIITGGKAEILTDRPGGLMDTLRGTIAWISDEAEFTPKIIQTRKERVNLVYAVKIRVENDGRLKIGMPGEANFRKTQ